MAHDRRPRSLGLFSLLLGASAIAGVSVLAQSPAAPTYVTFTKNIAPILQRSCQECHHAEGVGPMALVTYEDVPQGKPAPDMYLLAAKNAGVKADDCLVVEDSLTGVTAAVDAGCWTLGFTGTYEDQQSHGEKLKDIGAEAIFNKMADLPALVETFVR